MRLNFSKLFHEASKGLGAPGIHMPKDVKDWPKEWLTVEYKTYPRFEQIPLTREKMHADLYESIHTRKTWRTFNRSPIDLKTLSSILANSCGIIEDHPDSNPRRAHPSAGGLYPIEVYPLVFAGTKELPSGVYHYNIRHHALDVVWERSFSTEDATQLFSYPWAGAASVALIMTMVPYRSQQKYGERGYRYTLLEAGHIGQNICLNAAAQKLASCPLGGTWDKNIELLLDVDGISEAVIYAVLLG